MSEQKTLVVIINGRPRAGKDTFVAYLRHHLSFKGYVTDSYSSIQPIKDLLNNAGVYVGKKTDADRDLLSEIGDSLERHSEFRYANCLERIVKFHVNKSVPGVIFIHIREKYLTDKLVDWIAETPETKSIKIKLSSSRSKIVNSNTSDAGVDEIEYDGLYYNNGTLKDLDQSAQETVEILEGYLR